MADYLRMRNPRTGSIQDIPSAYVRDHEGRGWEACTETDARPRLHRELPGRHLGYGALVLASGPSASSVPPARLRAWADREGLVCWATNDVFRVCGGEPFPRADYLTILDDNFWYAHWTSIAGYLSANPSCVPVLAFDPGTEALSYQRVAVDMGRTPEARPAYAVNEYFHGESSGIVAVQMAMHAGCKRIFLLGHDCRVVGGRTHGAGVRCQEELVRNYPQGARMLAGYGVLAEHARGLGVTITNLSAGSAIECFPKISFEDAERPPRRTKGRR